ncbi:MAG: T9SS type A sorting domain-containing protein [Bacteroidales bacterium]|nr:T9SS type A sorting domain-containing protein [Bacteroidales bacterium]
MVRIYDLAGKEIFRQSMAAHELTVRIAEWPMGTYIVRVDTPNGSASKKLIKR